MRDKTVDVTVTCAGTKCEGGCEGIDAPQNLDTTIKSRKSTAQTDRLVINVIM